MTVYVDDLRRLTAVGRVNARLSRLFADTEAELRTFAEILGLPRDRIFHPGTPYAFHLVRERTRIKAIAAGATEVPAGELDQMINARRRAGLHALRMVAAACSHPAIQHTPRDGNGSNGDHIPMDRAAFVAAMTARRKTRIPL